jgi:hypothetical protein
MFRGGFAVAALAVLSLALAGCSSLGMSSRRHETPQCPKVVDYTDAQLTAIQDSLNKLPKGDPLRGAMTDYETLRDDSRYCANLERER